MTKKIISILSCLILFLLVVCQFCQNANTEPNYSYKIYTPQNITEVSKNVQQAQKNEQILFIVDFSNSMNDEINGIRKVDMARNTLAEILPKIPANVKTGLRVYGHKAGFTYLQGCQASTLSVPLALDNYQAILGSLYATNATGWTPITYSLKQAVNSDFFGMNGKKHIILLTDGGENCDESPCT